MSDGLSRRDFLKELLAAAGVFGGTLGGGRIFAAPPGWRPQGKPNLTVGLVSDTHLRTARPWPDTFYRRALEYFRDAGADVVVHCGDMANYGEVEAIAHHLEVWREVFPGGKAPDGRKVELLAVAGNHDLEGQGLNAYVRKVYESPGFFAQHILSADLPGHWERIWGEPYKPVWHKEIKGYHFFGRNWKVDEMETARQIDELGPKLGLDEGNRPFFLVSHSRPLPPMRNAMRRYRRNALAFFGHCHFSATDWKTVYYDSGTFPRIQVPPCISPDWDIKFAKSAAPFNCVPEGKQAAGRCRQGFVMRVWDDMLAIERREFAEGGSLGADWVMPFGESAPHPFSVEALKEKIGAPAFPADARLQIGQVETADGAHAARLTIPPADANPASRVYAYDVEMACAKGGERLRKTVYAAGCNMGVGHETNGGVTVLEVPFAELPPGDTLAAAVWPKTSLGTAGKAIAARMKLERSEA